MYRYIELVWYKAYADLRAEFARAYLGVLWWVLEPLLYMTAFYVIFGLLLERGGPGFISFLLCGLVVWRWFASSVQRGANAIPSNTGLMLQVYLPKYLFPAIVLVTGTMKFLIVFIVFLVYLAVEGSLFSTTLAALPLLLLIQLLWTAGCASLLAAIVPFAPDLKMLIGNVLMLMFFMSGVFFDISEFPEHLQFYFYLNPMAVLIDSYRQVLLHGMWPDWSALGMTVIASLSVLTLGLYLLTRYDRLYPRLIVS